MCMSTMHTPCMSMEERNFLHTLVQKKINSLREELEMTAEHKLEYMQFVLELALGVQRKLDELEACMLNPTYY